MYHSKDLEGLPVCDGSGALLGKVEGMGVDIQSGRAFLLVEGKNLKKYGGDLGRPYHSRRYMQ